MTKSSTLGRLLLQPMAIALLSLGLGACGFHLRNALSLPSDLGPLRVVSRDPYSQLGESLSEALTRAGATPAPAPVAADAAPVDGSEPPVEQVATLQIRSERWGTTPLSVDQRGRAQEYTLRYAVVFRLTRADGTDLVPLQVVELSRDYISVPTNSAGTEGEREILAKEMRRDMVASILRRIDAASSAPARVDGSEPGTPASSEPVPPPPAP
jgi:LPS-assembly lipoprotein